MKLPNRPLRLRSCLPHVGQTRSGTMSAGSIDQGLAAFGTHLTGWLRRWGLLLTLAPLDVVTLRVERAADEFAQPAHPVDQAAVAALLFALRTVFARFAHRDLDPCRGFGFRQRPGEGLVELADDR